MNLTITLGWWLLPLAATIASFSWAMVWSRPDGQASGYAATAYGVIGAIAYGLAIIISLGAWLLWAVLS